MSDTPSDRIDDVLGCPPELDEDACAGTRLTAPCGKAILCSECANTLSCPCPAGAYADLLQHAVALLEDMVIDFGCAMYLLASRAEGPGSVTAMRTLRFKRTLEKTREKALWLLASDVHAYDLTRAKDNERRPIFVHAGTADSVLNASADEVAARLGLPEFLVTKLQDFLREHPGVGSDVVDDEHPTEQDSSSEEPAQVAQDPGASAPSDEAPAG